jgi:opacity protein-like surface antigen
MLIMKKQNLIFTVILCFFATSLINAQSDDSGKSKKFHIRVDVGYGFGAGINSSVGESTLESIGSEITNQGDANENKSNIYGSYGKGLNATVSVGHKFNDFFGAEMGFSYVLGSKQTTKDFSTANGNLDKSETYTRQFRLKPALIFEAGKGKIVPFSRLGLVIPVAGASYGERDSNNPDGLSDLIQVTSIFPDAVAFRGESEAKGKFGIGFEGAVGAKFALSDNMAISAELFYTALRVKRKSYEITKAVIINSDGTEIDAVTFLAIGEIFQHTEYKDEINTAEKEAYIVASGSDYGSEAFPAWSLREDALFNAVGINIGFTYRF